jgi:hypothetical protein
VGKTGAMVEKTGVADDYLRKMAIAVATRTKKVTTPKNTIILLRSRFGSSGSVDL